MNTLQILGLVFTMGFFQWIGSMNVINHINHRTKELKDDINTLDRKLIDAYDKLK